VLLPATCLNRSLQGFSATAKWQLAFADSILGEDYRNVHQTTLPVNEKVQRAKSILNQTLLAEPENTYAKLLTAETAIKEGHAEKAFEFLSNLLKENSTQNSNWFDRIKAGFAWAAAFLQKFDVALEPSKISSRRTPTGRLPTKPLPRWIRLQATYQER